MRPVLVVLCLAAAACTCDPSAGTRNYRCNITPDCADGFTCVANKCTPVGGTGGSGGAGGSGGSGGTETNCSDGIDNDGDTLTDCEDPDCLHKPCSAGSPASVCCGQGSNATMCKNLGTDDTNCGGCGIRCETGRSCRAQGNGTISSGQCSCTTSGDCPINGQNCSQSQCGCNGQSTCASGQTCTVPAGDPGFCHY